MSTELSDLYTHHHGMHGEANPVEDCIYRASVADLVAALIAEGGETIWWCEEHRSAAMGQDAHCCRANAFFMVAQDTGECRMAEHLVFPIPAEKETTG